MRRRLRFFISLLSALLAGGLLLISPIFRSASAQKRSAQMNAAAQQQIKSLLDEKNSRSTAQKKIDSRLLYAMKAHRGEAMTLGGEVRTLRSAATLLNQPDKTDPQSRILVDIKAAGGGASGRQLIVAIAQAGGEISYTNLQSGSVRARVPFYALEELADLPVVKSIRPAAIAKHQTEMGDITINSRLAASLDPLPPPFWLSPAFKPGLHPDFRQRAMNVSAQLSTALTKTFAKTVAGKAGTGAVTRRLQGPLANVGAVTSEGDTAHRAAEARAFFGVDGAGVKIGVLSTGISNLAQSIATGDLPPDVTVLPGQEGTPDGEGTAILEIIHDLAPGAKLYFATAFNGIDSFADNIRALRVAGCDILVDDLIYGVESPFHDDVVSKAVEDVIDDGALYFSSAGNEGNFNDGTSSCWEGDFKDSGIALPSLPGGTLHDFSEGVISNRAETTGTFILGLWWSDPLGASDNDYDLFIMDDSLTMVLDASTNVQDGEGDPFEATIPGALAGERILIFKHDTAQKRALHLDNFGGQLGIATPGETHGHNSVVGAFGVGAIDVALANGGPFRGGPTNPVEVYSSDGYRRVFYKSDGTPI
ncbi:MAG: hypothetical protein J2P31_13140, partial [Blastocatellia bacterium]|nr:hypothetical protein [Blastocatellia bacterium]